MPPLAHFEKVFRQVINSPQMTRSKARQVLKNLLAEHGWLLVEDSELGDVVAYLRTSGVFVIVKLWVRPDRTPMPKFFVERFLKGLFKTAESCKTTPMFDRRACPTCEKFCLLAKRVHKYFLSNAPLAADAYAYFRANAKGTRLILAADARSELRSFRGAVEPGERDGLLSFFIDNGSNGTRPPPAARST